MVGRPRGGGPPGGGGGHLGCRAVLSPVHNAVTPLSSRPAPSHGAGLSCGRPPPPPSPGKEGPCRVVPALRGAPPRWGAGVRAVLLRPVPPGRLSAPQEGRRRPRPRSCSRHCGGVRALCRAPGAGGRVPSGECQEGAARGGGAHARGVRADDGRRRGAGGVLRGSAEVRARRPQGRYGVPFDVGERVGAVGAPAAGRWQGTGRRGPCRGRLRR
nr:MAG TPA: hypothetical protein [Caudoviricetes sp.]